MKTTEESVNMKNITFQINKQITSEAVDDVLSNLRSVRLICCDLIGELKLIEVAARKESLSMKDIENELKKLQDKLNNNELGVETYTNKSKPKPAVASKERLIIAHNAEDEAPAHSKLGTVEELEQEVLAPLNSSESTDKLRIQDYLDACFEHISNTEKSRTILSALIEAGEAGISNKDLADVTEYKSGDISAWYSLTAKKIPYLEKVSAGVWKFNTSKVKLEQK